jgi:SAM-dependent MidA family methyltransferase
VDWNDLPGEGIRGVVFANELLDAFPVHRLGWNGSAQSWFEWGVRLEGGQLAWARMPLSSEIQIPHATGEARLSATGMALPQPPPSAAHRGLPADLLAVLPDGFTIEVCPAASAWWGRAASALRRGCLLTFDYGLGADEFFAPHRSEGTLTSFCRHRIGQDLLADPGEQDLTAAVNFTALQKVGEDAGLTTEDWVSQEQFLVRIAERIGAGDASRFWTPARVRQFHTLTHPEHLGRALRVFLQRRHSPMS